MVLFVTTIRVFLIALITTTAGLRVAAQVQDSVKESSPLIPVKSQSRIYVGPVAGGNRSMYASGFQSVAGAVLCPGFTHGSGNGYYVGLSAEYLLGSPKDSKSSIIARVVYNYLPAYYEEKGDNLPSLSPDGQDVNSSVRHVAEIKYTVVDLEAIYKLNLFKSNFGIVVGPTVGMVLSADREEGMELVEPITSVFDSSLFNPGDVEYINNGRAIITGRDDIPDKSSIRVAVKAGVQYELPIGRLLLVPCIYYNYGITEVGPSANIRIDALQAGIDLRFVL